MASKKEYESTINKLLGTQIEWSNLSKEDLVQFSTVLAHPELIISKLKGKEVEIEKEFSLIGIVKDLVSGEFKLGDGTLIKRFMSTNSDKSHT